MSFNRLSLPIIALMALLIGCAPAQQSRVKPGNRYATGFTLIEQDTAIHPYSRIACNACTHVGFIKELGALDRLVGVTDKNLVYTPLPDSVCDLGNSMSPDLERILLSHPDVMLLSTYSQADETPKRIAQLGIPIIYINEWQETHPLARAEWIRVIGALTGHLHEADSIFNAVCEAYDSIANHRQSSPTIANHRPSILSGQDFRGTWYVPGGHTFMGQLFKDAGFSYRYADDEREQSIPLTTEQVLLEFEQADIWVGVQASSLDELAQIDTKHTWFKAFQDGQVYTFSKRTTEMGGNDFWETGVVHPEYILNDLRLIQSDKAQSDSLYFTIRLQ